MSESNQAGRSRSDVAREAARRAGQIQRKHAARPRKVDQALAYDVKLEVDRLSEEAIVETIGGAFPDDTILAEEGGLRGGGEFQRTDDIRPLVEHFLASRFGRYEVVITDELIEAMCRLDWPGNVRQLKHAVHRIALLAGDRRVLGPELLDVKAAEATTQSAAAVEPAGRALPAEPPRSCDTLARRRYIRDLFRHEVELTRAEIIRRVGCAPNTATRDLRELERQGLIRRVRTSGHLRTSYFQWTGKERASPHSP